MIATWIETLRGIAGKDAVSYGDEARKSGPTTVATVRPPERGLLVEIVRAAARDGIPLVPLGGNCCPREAADPAAPAILVDLTALDRVIEHARDDLTFTAEAGLSLARAQGLLRSAGQRLPLSSSRAERATLGGIVACAAEGPTRKAYGAVRDQILGVEVIHGDGRLTKAGGRVVKNVSGYDLCRLYCGARGRLGILTAITFRLRGLEPSAARFRVPFLRLEDAVAAGLGLVAALPDLFAVHAVLVRSAEGRGRAELLADARGEPEFVAAMRDEVRTRLGDLHDASPDLELPDAEEGGSRLEIAVLPTDLPAALVALGAVADLSSSIVVDTATGMIRCALPGRTPLDDRAEQELGGRLAPHGAFVDLPDDPRFHLRRFERFPSCQPEGLGIMTEIARTLDPKGILNPGRTEVPA